MRSSQRAKGQLPPSTLTERLMTIQEVAEYLRVSSATVRRWTRSALLVSYRPGGRYGRVLFSEKQVRDFLIHGRRSQESRQATEPRQTKISGAA